VEAEISAVPVEGLTLRGTFSYLLGRYDKFPGALDVLGRPVDASGEEFSNAGTGDPIKWAYSVSARYAFPLMGGVAGLQADWTWRAKHDLAARLTDPSLTPALVRKYYGSVGLLNLRADYVFAERTTIAVFATNALNKHYQRATLPSVSTGNVQYATTMEPRMVGLQITHSFGAGE
jgi:iron complex outermembrane receptor protein